MPDNVVNSDTLATFKKRLKTHLFRCVMRNVLATERLCISYHGALQVVGTVGSRAFSVAGPEVWNSLPPEVMSASSLTTFRTRLKTFMFTESYPDIRLI